MLVLAQLMSCRIVPIAKSTIYIGYTKIDTEVGGTIFSLSYICTLSTMSSFLHSYVFYVFISLFISSFTVLLLSYFFFVVCWLPVGCYFVVVLLLLFPSDYPSSYSTHILPPHTFDSTLDSSVPRILRTDDITEEKMGNLLQKKVRHRQDRLICSHQPSWRQVWPH